MSYGNQINLGQLIEGLKQCDQSRIVVFDFCNTPVIKTPSSFRGFYKDLAVGFDNDAADVTAIEFIRILEDSMGKTFEGYKGGSYRMNSHTSLWVANYGRSSNTVITGVKDDGYYHAIITTEWVDI